MEKVLIFGVGGFVGSYLSREFIEHGYAVIGTDKTRSSILPSEVGFYESDLLETEAVEGLVNYCQSCGYQQCRCFLEYSSNHNASKCCWCIEHYGSC